MSPGFLLDKYVSNIMTFTEWGEMKDGKDLYMVERGII